MEVQGNLFREQQESIKMTINFKIIWFSEDRYQLKSKNLDRESLKARKKSGESMGILCLKVGRHPDSVDGCNC